MIRSFRHKGLRQFFETGSKAGIQPGWNLHPLKGAEAGRWSVWVSGNWRLTFAFEGGHAIEVDYVDYH